MIILEYMLKGSLEKHIRIKKFMKVLRYIHLIGIIEAI